MVFHSADSKKLTITYPKGRQPEDTADRNYGSTGSRTVTKNHAGLTVVVYTRKEL